MAPGIILRSKSSSSATATMKTATGLTVAPKWHFPDAVVLASRINRSFFTAVPGLVTGIGLLVTFLAILFALAGLSMKGEQIEGMPRLLEGLSGKFVSSVAALFAASIFLPLERVLLHRLERSRQGLVDALDDLMPRLTAARILARLQEDISEQSTAFRAFNSDLSLQATAEL